MIAGELASIERLLAKNLYYTQIAEMGRTDSANLRYGLLMEGRSRFDCWSKLLGFDKK
jgi:hypothetical protein